MSPVGKSWVTVFVQKWYTSVPVTTPPQRVRPTVVGEPLVEPVSPVSLLVFGREGVHEEAHVGPSPPVRPLVQVTDPLVVVDG